MTIKELTRYKGMGPAKAITILAACELGKRRALDKIGNRPDLGSSLAIYNYMLPKMQDLDTEEAWVSDDEPELQAHQGDLYLTWRHHGNCRRYPAAHQGSRTQQRHHHRLLSQSSQQQSTTPARQTTSLPYRLQKACEIMRLFFMDHVIITDGSLLFLSRQRKIVDLFPRYYSNLYAQARKISLLSFCIVSNYCVSL